MSEFLQFLVTGVTIGATYALVALGFSIIFNASHVINFAQGEFVMIGGMTAVFLLAWLPLPLALAAAVAVGAVVGVLLYKGGIEPARDAGVVQLIIITIGAALFLRGLAQILWGKGYFALPAFSGEAPIRIFGAVMVPQSLWVLGVTGLVSSGGLPVSDAARNFDLWVMLAVAFACLPIMISGREIARWEGGVFLAGAVDVIEVAHAHRLLIGSSYR